MDNTEAERQWRELITAQLAIFGYSSTDANLVYDLSLHGCQKGWEAAMDVGKLAPGTLSGLACYFALYMLHSKLGVTLEGTRNTLGYREYHFNEKDVV